MELQKIIYHLFKHSTFQCCKRVEMCKYYFDTYLLREVKPQSRQSQNQSAQLELKINNQTTGVNT